MVRLSSIFVLALLAVFASSATLRAQQDTPAVVVAEPQRVTPVKIIRDFELGTELDRFVAYSNLLVERREKPATDAVWKANDRTTVAPTLIVLRDAIGGTERRLGARIDYYTGADGGTRDERASRLIDFEELKHLELALTAIVQSIAQAQPGKGETLAYHYTSRGGFTLACAITQTADGISISGNVDRIHETSKDAAVKMFEDCRTMVHSLVQSLSGM